MTAIRLFVVAVLVTCVGFPARDEPAAQNPATKLIVLYDNSTSQNYLLYGTPEVVRNLGLTLLRDEVSRAIADNAGTATTVRIASFGTRIMVSPAWVKTLSEIQAAFATVTQEGGPSPVWDGVYAAVQALQGVVEHRHMLLITDGKASANHHSFNEAREFAKQTSVTVTAVYVPSNKRVEAGEPDPTNRLKELASATGGRYVEKSSKELAAFCAGLVKSFGVERKR